MLDRYDPSGTGLLFSSFGLSRMIGDSTPSRGESMHSRGDFGTGVGPSDIDGRLPLVLSPVKQLDLLDSLDDI